MAWKPLAALMLLAPLVLGLSTRFFPEVIPGPGLPTLAEIGLTSADLYTMTPALIEPHKKRDALFDAVCETYSTADVDDVIACFNYLVAIGDNSCVVDGPYGSVQFVSSGTAQIVGSDLLYDDTSSTCYDVALGLQWIFTYCNVDGQVGGSQAAYGNGELIVTVVNIDY